MMADSLNPFDDETFRDISAATHASDDSPSAAAGPLEDEPAQHQPEPIARNGHHPFSGPLAPLRAPRGGDVDTHGRRDKLLPLILGAVGIIVILGCLGAGAVITVNLLSLQNALNSPQTTLDDFYSALHTSDYQSAYDQLSNSYQQRLTFPSFRATFELIGTIASYQVSNLQTQSDQASASVQVTLVSPDGGMTLDETRQVQLVLENGSWKVNRVSPNLASAIWPAGQPTLALDGADALCNMPMW
jgi:hypothetical protein